MTTRNSLPPTWRLGKPMSIRKILVTPRTNSRWPPSWTPRFPGSFLNLGRLALSLNDFPTAQSELEKAAAILPEDPKILSTLAYAQNGTHQFRNVLGTVERIHAVDHKGMANVHYVAAAAAMAIQDYDAMERQLNFLLSEDPTNAFAPVARQNLAALTRRKAVRAEQISGSQPAPTLVASQSVTFPNSDRLKAQLNGLGNESDGGPCDAECVALAEVNTSAFAGNGSPDSNVSPAPTSRPRGVWTPLRTSVDDVAVFFSVSSHGHIINDLEQSDIQIRDDNKPPKKIMQFIPQAKLPLRLALLVDTSGSVHDRFSFEKHAAAKFIEKILNGTSDLGFVEGFATEPTVTPGSQCNRLNWETGLIETFQWGAERRSSMLWHSRAVSWPRIPRTPMLPEF